MRLISETSEKKQPVLIVDPEETRTALLIKERLLKNEDIDVIVAKEFPLRLDHFFLIYAINCDYSDEREEHLGKTTKIIMVFIKQPRKARELTKQIKRQRLTRVKAVLLSDDYLDEQSKERLLWYSFTTHQEEPLLEISAFKKPDDPDPLQQKNQRVRRRFKRHYILGAILTLLVYGLITITLVIASSLAYLKTFSDSSGKPGAFINRSSARFLNKAGTVLYRPIRPLFFFFSVGLLPDTLTEMNTQLDTLSGIYDNLRTTSTDIARDVATKNKSPSIKHNLSQRIKIIDDQIAKAIELSSYLEQKIPKWNDMSENVRLVISAQKDTLIKLQSVPPLLESAIGKGTRKKYLVMISDTSTVRPGGGLMPYFGILTFNDMNLLSFDIYDTSKLDNARPTPIESTSAFRSVSGQNIYTLQNGLQSANFSDNYRQIADVLDKETGDHGFDGALLLTDIGIKQMIAAFTPVYLPEIKDTVTSDNYLIKYQIADDKKAFITSLIAQLQTRAEKTPSDTLVPNLLKALNEKQILFLSEDTKTADIFDKLYWSGTVPTPHCLIQSFGCTVDYIFPLQANIGDKPVNRYIEKSMSQRILVDQSGKISNTFTMKIHNASLAEIFPGGTYKSYTQIILPAAAYIRRITINGVIVDKPDVVNSTYTIVGFPFELSAQATKEIKVEYDLKDTFPKSKSIYQLIFQKQTGSPNSDIALEIILPRSATITNKNFSPVVKNGRVFYNTVLNADKLFILEIDNSINENR